MLCLNHKLSTATGLCAALIFSASLGGCEQKPAAYSRAKIAQYQQKGEFNAAAIVLKNFLITQPDNGEARTLLAAGTNR